MLQDRVFVWIWAVVLATNITKEEKTTTKLLKTEQKPITEKSNIQVFYGRKNYTGTKVLIEIMSETGLQQLGLLSLRDTSCHNT